MLSTARYHYVVLAKGNTKENILAGARAQVTLSPQNQLRKRSSAQRVTEVAASLAETILPSCINSSLQWQWPEYCSETGTGVHSKGDWTDQVYFRFFLTSDFQRRCLAMTFSFIIRRQSLQ
jgi:hypothetical protein